MKKQLALILLIILCSCSSTISKEDLSNLNGYWEIKKVTFPDGSSKEYKVSTTVDYIEINDLKGFRKKVQPKFDGTYIATNDAESFSIFVDDVIFKMYYKNNLSERKELIKQISKDNFSVINEEGITYTYNRYKPINVTN